jgi:RimJ/RimL family protein N-acetyltransferase
VSEAVAASVAHLRPWLDWARDEPKDLQARVAVLRHFRGQFDFGQDFTYGLFRQDEQQVLGSVALHFGYSEREFDIGYWVHAGHINQGLATEAAAALTKVAFEVHNAGRVGISCEARNLRSAAVPRKLGYIHEATLKKRLLDAEGMPQDTMIWSVFEDGYPGSPAAQAQVEAYDAVGRRIL